MSELLLDALTGDGVRVHLGTDPTSVSRRNGHRVAQLDDGGGVQGRELIVAAGRQPRVDGLGLDAIGLELSCPMRSHDRGPTRPTRAASSA